MQTRIRPQLVTTLSPELNERIRAMAHREEHTLAYYVNHALKAYLDAADSATQREAADA